jgi:trans-2,3-dihydro-3-hydroxyanthranilate isomerase
MPVYPFMQVDAFSDNPLGGNPCAILFDTDDLDSETMLAIARENNLSETAFVRRSQKADFAATYFTPAMEIPFAGHPTLATAFALIDSGRWALPKGQAEIQLELKVGVIPVEVIIEQGNITRLVMKQRKPEFLAEYQPAQILPAFGLEAGDLLPGARIQTVSTGTPQLMIPLIDHGALRRVQLDIDEYRRLRQNGDFFSPHLFCLTGASEEALTFARHLDVPPDLPEDPFTGSATGGMAAYLWRYGLIDKPAFIAEQGHWMGRPGKAWVEVIGPREEIHAVKVGGSAVTVIQGEFYI